MVDDGIWMDLDMFFFSKHRHIVVRFGNESSDDIWRISPAGSHDFCAMAL